MSSSSSDGDHELREKMKKEDRKRKAKAAKGAGDSSKKTKKVVEEKSKKTEDGKLSLGRNKFVGVNNFKGNLYIDFREYYESDAGLKPTKKGISLNVEQWAKLKSSIEEIDEMVSNQC